MAAREGHWRQLHDGGRSARLSLSGGAILEDAVQGLGKTGQRISVRRHIALLGRRLHFQFDALAHLIDELALLGRVFDPKIRGFGEKVKGLVADRRRGPFYRGLFLAFAAVWRFIRPVGDIKTHDERDFIAHAFARTIRNKGVGRIAFEIGRGAVFRLGERVAHAALGGLALIDAPIAEARHEKGFAVAAVFVALSRLALGDLFLGDFFGRALSERGSRRRRGDNRRGDKNGQKRKTNHGFNLLRRRKRRRGRKIATNGAEFWPSRPLANRGFTLVNVLSLRRINLGGVIHESAYLR